MFQNLYLSASETNCVRDELQRLESFPSSYIRFDDIQPRELQLAVEAYAAKGAPRPLDPYVSHFWQTFWPLKASSFHEVLLTQEIERRVNFRLHDQVLMLWADPINFQNKPEFTAHMQTILDRIRTDHRTEREKFDAELPNALNACRIQPPETAGMEGWLRARPSLAPGWRLHYELLQEWAGNANDNAKMAIYTT